MPTHATNPTAYPPAATTGAAAASGPRAGAGSLPAISTKDFISAADVTASDLQRLLETARLVKADPSRFARAMAGRSVVMLFEKPSLRTRMTFEVGAFRLGGQAIYYDHHAERIGQRESVKDYAKNLERFVQGIVARTYSHRTLELLAEFARVPVINALSDAQHPCQALADVLTLVERLGPLAGRRVCYVGDGNNVCVSLMELVSRLGVRFAAVCPAGYEPDAGAVRAASAEASRSGGSVTITDDLNAVEGADAVYTDTWVSMHQQAEADRRAEAFAGYQVNERLMARAGDGAYFMHCLPAHRGEEVTDEVIDGPRSLVYDQAENRLHAQNAVLLHTIVARTTNPLA
jgi:ornithine carbamoyltransferase